MALGAPFHCCRLTHWMPRLAASTPLGLVLERQSSQAKDDFVESKKVSIVFRAELTAGDERAARLSPKTRVRRAKIARVITGSTRSRRNRTHETQADHVKAFGEGINHPDRCFSPDVVVYPCRQEARLLTVLASNIAHGKDRIVVDAAFST